MVREGDTIIVSLDALRPAEVIELSSDPESDYDDYLRDGDRNNGAARATAGLSTPAKRKAEDQQGAAESLGDEGETPTSKRQRLPMRVKDTGVKGGHRRVEIEIPIPARRPKQPASQPAKEEDAEEHTTGEPAATEPASRKGHIHFDDDGRADQFFTPLEAPAQNPLETAHADASGSDSDSDAPPEAVSTSAAAAQTQQSARRAQRAAGEQAARQKRRRRERDALFKTQAQARAPPALLPAELLESDPEDEDGEERRTAAERPAKITFGAAERRLDRAARPPAERRVGATVFRPLAEDKDKHLAPRARRHSLAQKRELLRRGRALVRPRKGFFVSKR